MPGTKEKHQVSVRYQNSSGKRIPKDKEPPKDAHKVYEHL